MQNYQLTQSAFLINDKSVLFNLILYFIIIQVVLQLQNVLPRANNHVNQF